MIGRLLCLIGFHDVARDGSIDPDREGGEGLWYAFCRRPGCDW